MLEVTKIHTYYGKSHILAGISLRVNPSEVLCLLGRNGAGKTTTLKSIIGIIHPRKGVIRFKRRNITHSKPFEIARLGLGYVPENMRVFPDLTVRENLEMGVITSRIRKKGQRQGWDIEEVFSLFPALREMQNKRGMNLSGGQRQMLALSMALIGNPELLVLDEPTAGLAPLLVKELGRKLKLLKERLTILLTEQNIKFTVEVSDRGYFIEKGMVKYEGTIDELRGKKEIKEKYLGV